MPRRRRLSVTLAALLAAFLAPRIAHAQFSSDAALLTELLFQEQQAVTELNTVIANLKQANAFSQQVLTGRPTSEVGYALGILKASQNDYNALVQNTNSIGYSINGIHNAFTNLYPDGATIQTMPLAQFDSLQANAQTEIVTASEIAARSQTSVSEIETQTQLAATILQNSSGLDTIAGQLQLGLQLCSIMQADFTALIQNLAMTGRAMSDSSASQASEHRFAHERTRRNRLGYTSRGASVGVPSVLPPLI
jgi:conjugal transfer/entry exclusion protein